MFMKKLSSALVLALLSLSTSASELDLALSEETVALELYLDTDAVGSSSAQGAKIGLGGLYNEDDDFLGFIGLASGGSPGFDKAYAFGVGLRLYYAAVDVPDVGVGALALGANGRIKFSAGFPLAIAGDFHYAPKITTFEDGDDLLDTRIRLETDVSDNATAFVGYRTLTLGLKSRADYDVDDHVQLGVRFGF